jgi:hypothetical protein
MPSPKGGGGEAKQCAIGKEEGKAEAQNEQKRGHRRILQDDGFSCQFSVLPIFNI